MGSMAAPALTEETLLYGFGGLLFFQAYVTIRVARHKPYSTAQKRRQILLVWLLPFVGAAIALAGLAAAKDNP